MFALVVAIDACEVAVFACVVAVLAEFEAAVAEEAASLAFVVAVVADAATADALITSDHLEADTSLDSVPEVCAKTQI